MSAQDIPTSPGKIEEKLKEIDLATSLRHYEKVTTQIDDLQLSIEIASAELEWRQDAKVEVMMLRKKLEVLSDYRSKIKAKLIQFGAEVTTPNRSK